MRWASLLSFWKINLHSSTDEDDGDGDDNKGSEFAQKMKPGEALWRQDSGKDGGLC